MCFTGPQWKREDVQDHKFDFIDTRDYHSKSFAVRLRYIWVYVLVVKAFLVYMSDIFTAVTMLFSDGWTSKIYDQCGNNCEIKIQPDIAKWIFVSCIIFSFLLLGYEAYKSKKVIASRDISYAFTNVMANTYYSLRSYDHFCFFCQIENSTKKKDDFAFFIFFTFKGWKRLLLADGPRQSINALILWAFWLENGQSWDPETYVNTKDIMTSALFLTMLFTVTVFIGSLLLLVIAAICYVPLLCYIQGNLKEYCCHKVDKRIAELIKRKNKLRLRRQAQLARKEAAGDFSHLKDKNGQIVGGIPQPTLPEIDIDDEVSTSPASRRMPPQPPFAGAYGTDNRYWQDPASDARSMYSGYAQNPPYYYQQNGRPDSYYDGASDYGSTAHLSPSKSQIPPVPMDPRVHGPAMSVGQYNDPHHVGYPEYAQPPQEPYQYSQSQAGDRRSHGSGLAYDEPTGQLDSKSAYSDSNPPRYERRDDGRGGGYAM